MLKQILSNSYVEILIYIFCLSIIFLLLKKRINMEHFNNNTNIGEKKRIIYTIIPSAIEDNLYFGSFFSKSIKKHASDINNFVYTRSLKSNKWLSVPNNSLLDKNSLLIDLSYNENKHLVAIGLSMTKKEPVYNIYIKESPDYKSKWVKMNSNKKMRSLCYDINTHKLLGISSYDGQVYEQKSTNKVSFIEWIGPINHDKPMKKIMFDRDGIMLGIGLVDHFIYRKMDKHWVKSEWDTNTVNKTKVYDMFYDTDGCLIASSPEGIIKQLHPDFNSEFVSINEFNEKHEEINTKTDILKSRIGIEFIDDEFDSSTELGKDLKRIYEFKKISKGLCGKREQLKRHTYSKNNIEMLSKQNREINDMHKIIDDISNKMDY